MSGKRYPWIDAFDAAIGQKLASLKIGVPQPQSLHAVTITTDGQTIIAGDTDGMFHPWRVNVENWRELLESEGGQSFTDSLIDPLAVDDGSVTSIVRLVDGAVVSTHDSGRVWLSDPRRSAARIHSLDFDMTAATVSQDLSIFIGSTDGSIHRLNLDSGQVKQIVQASGTEVKDLAVLSDESRLAIVFGSRRVIRVNPQTGDVLWSQPGVYDVDQSRFQIALSSDGRFVALAGDDNRLTVWETIQQEPLLSKEFSGPGFSVALSFDGQLVARGGQNIDLFRVRSRESLDEFQGAGVNSLQFRNDGQYLASGHNDGSVRLVDLKAGAESVLRGSNLPTRSVAFGVDGRTILSADVANEGKTIRLWDTNTHERYGQIANPLPDGFIDYELIFKTIVVDERVMVFSLRAPYAKIAVWDLAR